MAENIGTTRRDDGVTVAGTCTVTGEVYSVIVPTDGWDRWRGGLLIRVDVEPPVREVSEDVWRGMSRGSYFFGYTGLPRTDLPWWR